MADRDDLHEELNGAAANELEALIQSMPQPRMNPQRRRALIEALDDAERDRAMPLWSRPIPLWQAAAGAAAIAITITLAFVVFTPSAERAGGPSLSPAPLQPTSSDRDASPDQPRDISSSFVVLEQPFPSAARDRAYQPDIRSWSVLSVSHGEVMP